MAKASTPQDHAKFSPSAAHRWMMCPGSIPATSHIARTTNKFADEGTAAHELAAWCLETGKDPWEFEMFEMHIYDGKCVTRIDGKIEVPEKFKSHTMWVVDQAMIEFIQDFINIVDDYRSVKNSTLLVEQRVDFSRYVGADDQFGTSDVVILSPGEITIIDLKYGRGVVVNADYNRQLMLYALGAYNLYSLMGDFHTVRMVISQPRVQHLSEFAIPVDELFYFAEEVGIAANEVRDATEVKDDPEAFAHYLRPGKEQCQWCPIKHDCPAITNHVVATVTNEDFVDMTQEEEVKEKLEEALPHVGELSEARLAFCMDQVGLIEGWCKAIRTAVYNKLVAGEPVEGYKIVRGRKGPRKWADEDAAEDLLVKSMKLKHAEAYKKKLISPSDAEKLLKSSKRRWNRVLPYITQSEGSLSVAPQDDKRQAVELDVEFEDLSQPQETEESLL